MFSSQERLSYVVSSNAVKKSQQTSERNIVGIWQCKNKTVSQSRLMPQLSVTLRPHFCNHTCVLPGWKKTFNLHVTWKMQTEGEAAIQTSTELSPSKYWEVSCFPRAAGGIWLRIRSFRLFNSKGVLKM